MMTYTTCMAVLIVLTFACWTASSMVLARYERKLRRDDVHAAAGKFSGMPAATDADSGPVVGRLTHGEIKIDTSFGNERIGKI